MAGDYILIDHEIFEKPEVLGIHEQTGVEIDLIVARLIRLWRLADRQTIDGFIPFAGPRALARQCGGDEVFWVAVASVGWLLLDERGSTIPHFSERFGESARGRMKAAKKKKNQRAAEGQNRGQNRGQHGGQHGDTTGTGQGHDGGPEGVLSPPIKYQVSSISIDHKETAFLVDEKNNANGCATKGDGRATAVRLFKGVLPYADKDKLFLLAVARLLDLGLIAEDSVIDALEAITRATKPIANPVGYFRKVLTENVAADCGDLAELLASVKGEVA